MADVPRSDQRVVAAETRSKVVALRRNRVTFEEIGRVCGFSKQRAYTIYRRALAEIPALQVSEHRAEEIQLADDAVRNLLKLARDHDRHPRTCVEAWNAIRGWSERKARLLGLDAPAQARVEVVTMEMIDAEIRRLEAELGQAAEGGV